MCNKNLISITASNKAEYQWTLGSQSILIKEYERNKLLWRDIFY